jgi:hypothetical protein
VSSDKKDEEGETTDVGSQATQDKQAKEKRPPKPRKPNQLSEGSFVISRVDNRGVPMSPYKIASGYNNAIGVIVCETVHITCNELRAKDEDDIRKLFWRSY